MEVEDKNVEDPDSMENMVKRSLLARNKLAIIIKGSEGDVQYCCVQCPTRCSDKRQLEKHLFTHNNEYRYLCGICGTGLKRKEHLERHTLEHLQVRPHVCEICSKAFKRKEHLNIHRSIHSGDKTEVCMLCQKSFYRKDHLQKHLQTHSKVFIEQNISLADQDLIGIKAEVMELNVSEHFDDTSQDQDEAEIEDIEITPDQHYPMVASPQPPVEDRPYACHLCEKTYKRKDHLKLHSRTHMKKDRICSECGEGFTSDETLLYHMNMHLQAYSVLNGDEDKSHLHALLAEHNIDPSFLQTDSGSPVGRSASQPERRHECSECGRKFKRRQHLIVHSKVHAKTQPNLWCAKCRQGFHMHSDFEAHTCITLSGDDMIEEYLDIKIENPPPLEEELDIKIVNPPLDAKKENEWPHQIQILPLEQQEDSTQYPIRDESALPVPRRVYVCKFCNKPFKRKDHYRIHLHIHTGVKSFFCTDCGKGFYRKDHLQKHAQVHAKAKQTKPKKAIPDLFPINKVPKKSEDTNTSTSTKEVMPEITIHAPSNTKLRVPLQIKVPYQVVMSMDNGEQRAVTIDPQASEHITL